MKTVKVKDLMTRISDYPNISKEASLREALQELEKAEGRFVKKADKPRAILILDGKRVIGKVSGRDVLRALEPRYKMIGDEGVVPNYGWNAAFIKSMVTTYGLLQGSVHDTCCEIAEARVLDIMTPLDEAQVKHHEKQIVDEDACLNEAIHLFVMGDYPSLYVRRGKEITGLLRMVDVCGFVYEAFKQCPGK